MESRPLVTVNYRPLSYRQRGGRWTAEEKGIDVLCALAVVNAAQRVDIDLVVLASHDTDLEPVLDFTRSIAKIETLGWLNAKRLRTSGPGRLWDTRLGMGDFDACVDTKTYFPDQ